jgi:hypothetical protein
MELKLNAENLSMLVGASLFAVVIAGAVTYQGNPKGRKWLCLLPLSTYAVFGLGSPIILAILTGQGVIDVETSRLAMSWVCIAIISICAYFSFKYW